MASPDSSDGGTTSDNGSSSSEQTWLYPKMFLLRQTSWNGGGDIETITACKMLLLVHPLSGAEERAFSLLSNTFYQTDTFTAKITLRHLSCFSTMSEVFCVCVYNGVYHTVR